MAISMSEIADTVLHVKEAMRIVDVDNEFDWEIACLIKSAAADLGIAGITGDNAVADDPLVYRAIVTYCRMGFGTPDDYDRLKQSYDEQKAQLQIASGYTEWGNTDGQV